MKHLPAALLLRGAAGQARSPERLAPPHRVCASF